MKILLTGATGFLGKNVLRDLVADERVTRIVVTTRQELTHPSPKVRMARADLTDVDNVARLEWDYDAVIHLAGLYDFTADFARNYANNVVPTLNIVTKVEELNFARRVPLYFASTYAVGLSSGQPLAEEPLTELAPRDMAYAFTKGIAERIVTDSKVPSVVYRLGVLVGNDQDGGIEKIDGPYYVLKLLAAAQGVPGVRWMKKIPIPANPQGTIPFVPVNFAAAVIHQSLFHPKLRHEAGPRILGVYDLESVNIAQVCRSALERFLPGSEPLFVTAVPKAVQSLYGQIDRGRAEVFRFSSDPIELRNERFREVFGDLKIPHFSAYQERFFQGFANFVNGFVS
jgi:nucleoside-diphosphate-sugar epimerase